jgi:tRNA dimethylallyltransferase
MESSKANRSAGGSDANLLVILGPTASGKTALGVALARLCGGEILSVDSRQVYRGLDIGSGKDLEEYSEGGVPVPYHLIDIVDLDVEYNVFDFQKSFFEVFENLQNRRVPPIAVGGSGMYLEAVLKAYRMVDVPVDDELRQELAVQSVEELRRRLEKLRPVHNTTDLTDRERLVRAIEIAEHSVRREPEPAPEIRPLVLGVRWDRSVLRRRIHERLALRLEAGLIEEVEGLHAAGVSWERLRLLGLEYRYVADFLQGLIKNANDLKQKLGSAICAFAKRQDTWFRRMERRGVDVQWIEAGEVRRACQVITSRGGFANLRGRLL